MDKKIIKINQNETLKDIVDKIAEVNKNLDNFENKSKGTLLYFDSFDGTWHSINEKISEFLELDIGILKEEIL